MVVASASGHGHGQRPRMDGDGEPRKQSGSRAAESQKEGARAPRSLFVLFARI